MGYGIYEGLVDFILYELLNLEGRIQESLRSTLIDSLEMTTILLFLIVNTIMLIWLERKVWPRMMNMRGIVFIDFNWSFIVIGFFIGSFFGIFFSIFFGIIINFFFLDFLGDIFVVFFSVLFGLIFGVFFGIFFGIRFGKLFGKTWKFGLLQNIAEFLKFFAKEDIVPEKADKFPFNIGFFAFVVAPPFMLGALLPLGTAVIADPAVGFLLIFSLFALYPIGVLITGWSSNNKYSLLGAFRSAAQLISYEIPLMLSVGAVVIVTNSFSLVKIAEQQRSTQLFGITMELPYMVLMPIGFIVFMVALAAETERIPFDIPEAEAELVMGWRTELTGFRYMMSMATEYFILLIGSFVGVSLFWGGPYIPFNPFDINTLISEIQLLALGIFVVKLWVFIFLYIWVRSALPRVRIDQLLDIGWKRLIPLAVINIIFVIIMEITFNPSIYGV